MISEFPLLRLGAFIGLLVLMFLIEGRWPARSWTESRASRAWFSAKLALLNNVFFRVVVATPFVAFTYFVSEQGWGIFPLLKPYLPADDQLRTVFEIGATIVVFDFFDYLKHRWFHRVGFMWRAHRVHHTDTHLDVFTALRYHPGELLISAVTYRNSSWQSEFYCGKLRLKGFNPVQVVPWKRLQEFEDSSMATRRVGFCSRA